MANYNPGSFKFSLLIIVIMVVILAGLNYQKYYERRTAIPVWSEYDEEYLQEHIENKGVIDKLKQISSPRNIIYKLTRIRLNVPITYLKREIALLGYYTPESLKTSEKRVYEPGSETEEEIRGNNRKTADNMIQLQFDFSSDGGQMGENSISGDRMADSSAAGSVNNSNNMRPVVALYHSHTSETYIDDPRDQDANGRVFPGNLGQVVRVGQELATILSRKYDFKVIHSTEIHDESYVRSYYNSRKTVKNLLKNEPQLEILFDLHRDGVKSQGREAYTTTFKGKNIARVMIVVTNGKFDFAHLDLEEHHLQWQQNLNFARTLAAKMEEMYPGLLKRVEIRDTTYNQDLHPQALLLEIGDYQNTTSEALRSAGMVADVIAAVTYSSQQ